MMCYNECDYISPISRLDNMSDIDIEALKTLALGGGVNKPLRCSSSQFAAQIGASAQTASRRLRALEKEGMISRTIQPNGQTVTITRKGIDRLRGEYSDYQKIFTPGEEHIEIHGILFTGLGEGQYYLSQDGYVNQFQQKLGFTPYPGTLNLNLNGQSIVLRQKLDEYPGIKIEPFNSKDRTFGGGKCHSARINNIGCAVVIPDRTHYPHDVLEVIARQHLRTALEIADGDEVVVVVTV